MYGVNMAKSPQPNIAEARHFTHLALHGPTGINRQMRRGMSFTDAHAHVMKGRQLAMQRAKSKGGVERAATWSHVVNTLSSLNTQEKFNAYVAGHDTKSAHTLPGFRKTSTFGQNSLKGLPTRSRKSPRPTKVAPAGTKASSKRAGGKPTVSSPTGGHRAFHDMMTTAGRKALGTKVKRTQTSRSKMQSHVRGTVKPTTARHVSAKKAGDAQRGMAMKRGYYYRTEFGKRTKVKYSKKGQGKRRTQGGASRRRR